MRAAEDHDTDPYDVEQRLLRIEQQLGISPSTPSDLEQRLLVVRDALVRVGTPIQMSAPSVTIFPMFPQDPGYEPVNVSLTSLQIRPPSYADSRSPTQITAATAGQVRETVRRVEQVQSEIRDLKFKVHPVFYHLPSRFSLGWQLAGLGAPRGGPCYGLSGHPAGLLYDFPNYLYMGGVGRYI
jgi:hypothetical protein